MFVAYRVSELEELRMLLGKRHRSAEDIATVFEMIIQEVCGSDCNKCPICFDYDEVFLCRLMEDFIKKYKVEEK